MTTLSSKLRATIRDHIDKAPANEIRAITALLCAEDHPPVNDAEIAVAARSRFEVAGDVVRDRHTGLEWTRKDVSDKRLDRNAAKEACDKLELDGGGWRLPTIKELLSLVDYERHDPAIDPAFECKSDWYWTSTPWAASPAVYSWFVNFSDGDALYSGRGGYGFVRAVRGGQF